MILWVFLIMGVTFYIDLAWTCVGGGGGGGGGGGSKSKGPSSNVTNSTNTTTTNDTTLTTTALTTTRRPRRSTAAREADLASQMPGYPVPANILKNWTDWLNKYRLDEKADNAAYQDNTYPWGAGGDDYDYFGAGFGGSGGFGGAGGFGGTGGGRWNRGPGFGNHWGPRGFAAGGSGGAAGVGGVGTGGKMGRYGDSEFIVGPDGKLIRKPSLQQIWPKEWKGLGKPHLGFPPQEPPPFAMAPVDVGLPTYCYQPLDNGTCPNEVLTTKWFYNSYINQCFEFIYTGCNGNNNRFNTESKCLLKCNIENIPTGCEEKSDLNAHFLKDFDGTDPSLEGRKRAC